MYLLAKPVVMPVMFEKMTLFVDHQELEEEEKRKREEEEAAAAQDAAAASHDVDSDLMGVDTEESSSQDPSGKKQGKKATKKKGNKKASTRKNAKKPAQQNGSDLTTKVCVCVYIK